MCIQGYHSRLEFNPSAPERMRQLFWQSQGDSERAFDWGLRLELNETIVCPGLDAKHGFVDYRWPSQKVRNITDDVHPGDSRMYQKSTTYIQDGRLIQVVAIACDDESVIKWKIGGEVQMSSALNELSAQPSQYSINVSNLKSSDTQISVLTVEGKFLINDELDYSYDENLHEDLCLDVAVFLNRKSQSLDNTSPTTTQQSTAFANFTREGDINLVPTKGQCLVAVFSFRERNQKMNPLTMSCPSWPELRNRLGIRDFKIQPTDTSRSNLYAALVEKTGISQLDTMPDIVTRTVEQLCSMAISTKLYADDLDQSDEATIYSATTADEPEQVAGTRGNEAGYQSVISIVNNLVIEPIFSQYVQEPYL